MPHCTQGSARLKPSTNRPLNWPETSHSSQDFAQLKPTTNGPLDWLATLHSTQGSAQLKTSKVVDWVATTPVMQGFEMLKHLMCEQHERCMTVNNTTATEGRRHLKSKRLDRQEMPCAIRKLIVHVWNRHVKTITTSLGVMMQTSSKRS